MSKLYKMLMLFICMSTLFSFTQVVIAQNYSVKGIVLEQKTKSPIDNAAIVFRTVDSTFLGTTISDSKGEFSFNLSKKMDKLLLQIHHLNYKNYTKLVYVQKNLGELFLESKEQYLEDVVVKNSRPIVEIIDGNLRYSIQTLMKNSSVSNAYDMLSKLPGIMKIGDKLSLIGSQKYIIAINGKPMSLEMTQVRQILQGLPSDQVQAVDILYNAPPQYRINASVINIILKNSDNRQAEETIFQGNVSSTLSYNRNFSNNSGLSLNYKKKGFNVSAFYNYQDQNNVSLSNLYSKHKNLNNELEINQNTDIQVLRKSHNAYVDMSYTRGKSIIEADYTLQLSPSISKTANSTNKFKTSFNKKNYQTILHNAELIYKYTDLLTIGGDITTYYDKGQQNLLIQSSEDKSKSDEIYDFQQKVLSYKLFTDINHSLKNNWNIGYGASFMYSQDYNLRSNKIENDIDTISNETLATVYVKVAKRFSQSLSCDISLSGEYSYFNKEKHFNLFPKFNLSYIPNMNHMVQLSFQSDKIYPAFWEKKPYVINIDSYMQKIGNPLLIPYNEYTARINYILKRKYVISTYYTAQAHYFIQQAYQSDTKHRLIFQSQNWDYQRLLGVLGVIPFNITDRIHSTFTSNVFLTHVKHTKFHALSFNRKKITAYFALNTTAALVKKHNLYFDISAFYMLNPIQGIYDLSNPFGLDLGLKWSSPNKKFDLVLKCTDITRTETPKIKVHYQNQYFDMTNYEDTRGVILTLKYNFGNYKSKKNKNIDTSRFGL